MEPKKRKIANEYARLMAIANEGMNKGCDPKRTHFRGDRWDRALWKLPKI